MRTINSRFAAWRWRTVTASVAGLAAVGAAAVAVTATGSVQHGGIVAASSNTGGCNTYDVQGAGGWNIGVCIGGGGLTATPDIYVNSIGSAGSSCTIDIETWDGNNNRLGDTQLTCPTSTGQVKGDPVTVNSAVTVHSFARLHVDGTAYESGDSKPIDLAPDPANGAVPSVTAGPNDPASGAAEQ